MISYRHDADGPRRVILGYGHQYVRVFVNEGRVEAPARYRVDVVNNINPKRKHGKRTIQKSDVLIEKCKGVRDG